MNIGTINGIAVGVVAVACAIVYAVLGARSLRCDAAAARPRFAIAFVSAATAALVLFSAIPAVVGYGMVCLALASVYLADLLREEHARRRRVASLTPRPPAEAVPTVWIGIAVTSVLLLTPYVLLDEQRIAALMVAMCAVVMGGIAWRIASAPLQLEGTDIQTERLRERASRTRKVGITAVIAIGSVFVFISFVNAGLPMVLPFQRLLLLASLLTWSGLWAWVTLYWRRLDRLSCSAP